MKDRKLRIRLASATLRLALATAFLSAVADRFGLWGPHGTTNVAWGNFAEYLKYTGVLLSFLPAGMIPVLGWIATVGEIVLAVGLLVGWQLRWFALGSALLLFSFAATMTLALGAEPALSYSVWTGAAAALLLACVDGGRSDLK